MSVRRPKMQIKPKVLTRAMTANAAIDATAKKTEAVPKTADTHFLKEAEVIDKPSNTVNSSDGLPLTTSFVAIVDTEVNTSADNYDKNVCEERLKTVNKVISVTTEDCNKISETKETIVSEMDSKSEKTVKTKKSRKRKTCRSGQTSDKSVMRMKDLLLYNPPMTDEQKEMREKDTDLSDKQIATDSSEIEIPKVANEEEGPNVGPRVKVGADGQLILDEESVIVKRKRADAANGPALLESASTTSACTNYSSFRNKTRCSSKPRWTEHETIRFYSALNTIGTDFTLMADLFFRGKRSRLDLRNKFKKEEKVNKLMIDEALFSPNTFINQCPELDDILGDSSDSDDQQKSEKHKLIKNK